ncbi:MAG: exonuclease [Gammaproteobacteria bacterium]|nr:MAG: exonuclease [Gammaproteobacteria bacterium]
MLQNYRYFLIVDLEATCCDDSSIAKNDNEIIEIGAVMVDSETMCIIDEFNAFIKPTKHPLLTDFCTELTSITQNDVNKAAEYPAVSKQLSIWLNNYDNYVFCSWGNYDRNHIASESLRHHVPNPISMPHVNLKKAFAKMQKVKKMGMKLALDLCNIKLRGTHHRGIDDARNIVKLMPYIIGDLKA